MGFSSTLADVVLKKLAKAADPHPAAVAVLSEQPVVGSREVKSLSVTLFHMPFKMRRPRRLKRGDPRASPNLDLETWGMVVNFQQKPGTEQPYRLDLVFQLARRSRPTTDSAMMHRMTVLARAQTQKTIAEDLGLKWIDGEGFKHERSGLPVVVGFEAVQSQSS